MASSGPYDPPPPTTGRPPLVDPLLWVGLVVWALCLLPSFVPVLSPEARYTWANLYADFAPLLVVLVAAGLASRSTASRERSFWLLMAAFVGTWLCTRLVYMLVSTEEWHAAWDLTNDSLYLAGYLLLATALERRPDRNPPPGYASRLQQIETFGMLVFAFGLLGYFIVIPRVLIPEVYASKVPSLLLYVVLDAFLLIRVLAIMNTDPGPKWRWPYRWLALTFGIWLAADAVEGLLYIEALPWIPPGGPADILWHLPSLTLILAVSSRTWPMEPVESDEAMQAVVIRRFRPGGQGLIAFALTLPLLHSAFGVLGWADPTLERMQMALVLGMVLLLGSLLVWHQLLLRRMANFIEADRVVVSNQLQMAQRMEAVGRLAAGVAHDFSNVLSVIRGRAELLLMSQNLSPQARDDVEEAVEATRRGQALVTHLLTISRRKSGDPHTLDLSDVAQDVKDLMARVLPEGITLTVESSHRRSLVVADRAQLEQVVLNLILNARDALQGRGSIRVRTGVVEVDDQFAAAHGMETGGTFSILSVSDNGPGVPVEIRELVFEPFFSTKDNDVGSGLGLSVIYGIVRQARGLVRVGDSDDGGALFEVYLPLAEGLPTPRSRSVAGRPLPGRETVLLADNHGPVRRTSARILREAGYRVIEAEYAVEALAMLERRNEHVDVLVTDAELPDLPGHELRTRSMAHNPELAVVLVSGQPEGVTPIHMPEDTLILRKPIAPDLLTMSVRRALAQARERGQD